MPQPYHPDAAPGNEPATPYIDLAVRGAQSEWQQIRWALFVFPDITDVAPTGDPDVVRVFYEGSRPYPYVWTVELRQRGFDVPSGDQRPGQEPRTCATDRGATAGVAETSAADPTASAWHRATPMASGARRAARSPTGSG